MSDPFVSLILSCHPETLRDISKEGLMLLETHHFLCLLCNNSSWIWIPWREKMMLLLERELWSSRYVQRRCRVCCFVFSRTNKRKDWNACFGEENNEPNSSS
jgi:hypothetical protein